MSMLLPSFAGILHEHGKMLLSPRTALRLCRGRSQVGGTTIVEIPSRSVRADGQLRLIFHTGWARQACRQQ